MTYSPMAPLSSTCRYLEVRIRPKCGFFFFLVPSEKEKGANGEKQCNNYALFCFILFLKNSLFLWIFQTPCMLSPTHALVHMHTTQALFSIPKVLHIHTSTTWSFSVCDVKHSICQQIWKTQQWPQDWKRSVFTPIPKKGNAKECSNYHTIALISHASKVMLKIL